MFVEEMECECITLEREKCFNVISTCLMEIPGKNNLKRMLMK